MAKGTKRRGRGEGAAFYSQAKGCWIGRVRVRGRVVERSAPTKALLLRRLAEASPPAGRDGPTVGERLGAWLASCPRLGPGTRQTYGYVIRAQLAPRLGRTPLARLDRNAVKAALADMAADGLSAAYVRKAATVLRSFCNDMADAGHLEASPAAGRLGLPRQAAGHVDVMGPDEVRAVLEAGRGLRYGAFAATLLLTGLRRAEALALEWGDLDLERRTLRVSKALYFKTGSGWLAKPPKTARGRRVIDVPDLLAAILEEHRRDFQPDPGLPVFATRRGLPPHPAVARRGWDGVLRRADVRPRTPHVARHTHASALLEAGASLSAVAARLGDAEKTVASTYAHLIRRDGHLGRVVQGLYGP